MHGSPNDPSVSSDHAPSGPLVGVFDSGLGGLTVVSALRRIAPSLPLLYLADTAWFPYGDRPEADVRARAVAVTERLIEAGCGLIVVACNTASSAALEHLRERFSVPIVGMEPPLKPATERTRSGRVAVLATHGTARGERLARLSSRHAADVTVVTVPLPGLADRVERGEVSGPAVEAALRRDLASILGSDVDAVALGCTHYGFLRPVLQQILGSAVEIIDAADPVALHVVARRAALLTSGSGTEPAAAAGAAAGAAVRTLVTGDRAAVAGAITRLRAGGVELPPLRLESGEVHSAAISR